MIFPFANEINSILLTEEQPYRSDHLKSTIYQIIDSGKIVPVLFLDNSFNIRTCIAASKVFCNDLTDRSFTEKRTTFLLNLYSSTGKDTFDPFKSIAPVCVESWSTDKANIMYKIPNVTNLINADTSAEIDEIALKEADFTETHIKPFAIITPALVKFLIENPINETATQLNLNSILDHFRKTGISRGPRDGKTRATLGGLQDIVKFFCICPCD